MIAHELSRTAVIDVYARLLDAWNARDAEAFAALFSNSGSSVGFDGSAMNGRDEIGAELATIFAHHATGRYVAIVRDVQPIAADVALLRAVVGMIPPASEQVNPAVNAVQSVVVALDEGRAAIVLLHNTPAAYHGRPHLGQQLTEELTRAAESGRVVTTA